MHPNKKSGHERFGAPNFARYYYCYYYWNRLMTEQNLANMNKCIESIESWTGSSPGPTIYWICSEPRKTTNLLIFRVECFKLNMTMH